MKTMNITKVLFICTILFNTLGTNIVKAQETRSVNSNGNTNGFVYINLDGNSYTTDEQYNNEEGNSITFYFKSKVDKSARLFLKGDFERFKLKGIKDITVNDKKISSSFIELQDSLLFLKVQELEVEKYYKVRVSFWTNEFVKNITDVALQGDFTEDDLVYVHDFSSYWGRRGPSVHLKYEMPKGKNGEMIEWFYNEVQVPAECDVVGTYIMTNGFGEGYCGLQVNSKTERRVLFSLWSPFETDYPDSIPLEDRITVLKKGDGVVVSEFGNEGSGGQTYLRYNWKAEVTYKIIVNIKPLGNNTTQYSAFFFDENSARWRLISSMLRPSTYTYYTNPHSFLENFIPENGNKTREAIYKNQWVRDANGEWFELRKANFTYDETARKGVREDYFGGVKEDDSRNFYLKNCGYFDANAKDLNFLEREPNGEFNAPDIEELEALLQ